MKLSQMSPPGALTGLELVPVLQGAGVEGNRGLLLAAMHGLPRGVVLAHRVVMAADLAATADADPGAAKVRWNDADPGEATVIYISDADADAGDVAAALAAQTVGGYLYLQACAESERRAAWQKWQVTGYTAASGYGKVAATLVASDGEFEDGEALELTIQQRDPPSPTSKHVQVMISDMTTALATGTRKAVWFAPEDGTLIDIWIAVDTVSSSGDVRVDLNDAGGSVLSTRPAIDASESTSLTGTAAVLDGTVAFSRGDKFTFDIDDAGTGAKGLMSTLEYEPA